MSLMSIWVKLRTHQRENVHQASSTVSWAGSKSSSSSASFLTDKATLLTNWNMTKSWITLVTLGKVHLWHYDVIQVYFSSSFNLNHEKGFPIVMSVLITLQDSLCFPFHIPFYPFPTLCPQKINPCSPQQPDSLALGCSWLRRWVLAGDKRVGRLKNAGVFCPLVPSLHGPQCLWKRTSLSLQLHRSLCSCNCFLPLPRLAVRG